MNKILTLIIYREVTTFMERFQTHVKHKNKELSCTTWKSFAHREISNGARGRKRWEFYEKGASGWYFFHHYDGKRWEF